MTAGSTIPLSNFFIASPSTPIEVINEKLAEGKNLLLTPWVYNIGKSVAVKRANTVVLGLGHATLTAVNGAVPMTEADVPGVIIAGVTIDAGTVESPVLLQVGKKNGNNSPNKNDPSNPTTLSDVYFRVGGPHIGKAVIALEVNSNNVLIDHTWVWRADHGSGGPQPTSARACRCLAGTRKAAHDWLAQPKHGRRGLQTCLAGTKKSAHHRPGPPPTFPLNERGMQGGRPALQPSHGP